MSQEIYEFVINAAKSAHAKYWHSSGDEGTGDKLAKLVTDTWQKALESHNDSLKIEYLIAPCCGLKERIDVVDVVSGIAYEMKVSHNNPHMEFYRDIFKVLIARDNGFPHLKRFVFLTPKKGAEHLLRGMGKVAMEEGPRLGLKIEVVPL